MNWLGRGIRALARWQRRREADPLEVRLAVLDATGQEVAHAFTVMYPTGAPGVYINRDDVTLPSIPTGTVPPYDLVLAGVIGIAAKRFDVPPWPSRAVLRFRPRAITWTPFVALALLVGALAGCEAPTAPSAPLRPTFKMAEAASRSTGGGKHDPSDHASVCTLGQTTRSWECQWRAGLASGVSVGAGVTCAGSVGVDCAAGAAGTVYGWNDWWNHQPTDEGTPVPASPYHCLDCGFGDPGLRP